MILAPGNAVLVTHRRLFDGDHGRYFLGIVDGYDAGVARVTGHTWTRDGYRGDFVRKQDQRTKIVAIASGTVLVYQLPEAFDLASARIVNEGADVALVDGRGHRMDLSEGHLAPPPQRAYVDHGRRAG